MDVLEIARLFKFVRELPDNKGLRVEAIQQWGGGQPGDSWCAYWATMVLDLRDQGKCWLKRTGSCDVILKAARMNKWVVAEPEPGDLYLNVRNVDDAYHVGFVTTRLRDGIFGQISGNTSSDGLSSNGDGVYERDIRHNPAKHVFVRVPKPQE